MSTVDFKLVSFLKPGLCFQLNELMIACMSKIPRGCSLILTAQFSQAWPIFMSCLTGASRSQLEFNQHQQFPWAWTFFSCLLLILNWTIFSRLDYLHVQSPELSSIWPIFSRLANFWLACTILSAVVCWVLWQVEWKWLSQLHYLQSRSYDIKFDVRLLT